MIGLFVLLVLIGSFLFGVTVIVNGKLKTSKRRQIVGRTATLVGLGLIVFPIVAFACGMLVGLISYRMGSSIDDADTHGNIALLAILSSSAIIFAANLKRLSVPISPSKSNHDLFGPGNFFEVKNTQSESHSDSANQMLDRSGGPTES
jgi:MFS family permease